MDDKSVNISPKILIWIGISVIVIVIAIIFLNSYNDKRKYSQFENLNNIVVNSAYLNRFNSMTANFSPKDTLQIKSIKENLGLLRRDYDEIDYAKIVIKKDSFYHTISSFQNYRKNLLMDNDFYLPKDVSKFIKLIEDNDKVDLKEMYLLSKDKVDNGIMFKINNHSYLFVEQNR
jgi:hypothetical protein